MADAKISSLTAVTTIKSTDLLPIVVNMETTPETDAISGASLATGWTADASTWTYASASTFTIAGNVTTTYKPGVKLRWTQTTIKYGTVRSSAYSAPNTTVTIVINTDYTIANAAITVNSYSYSANPQNFPGWFNYAPTITWTAGIAPSSPTVNLAQYNIQGSMCTVNFFWAGTAGATVTAVTWSLPVTPAPTLQCSNGMINISATPNATYADISASTLRLACTSGSHSRALGNATFSW